MLLKSHVEGSSISQSHRESRVGHEARGGKLPDLEPHAAIPKKGNAGTEAHVQKKTVGEKPRALGLIHWESIP